MESLMVSEPTLAFSAHFPTVDLAVFLFDFPFLFSLSPHNMTNIWVVKQE
jgi:hypothetical protein